MSIEAMKQVIELYDKHCYNNDYGGIEFNKKHGYKFIEAVEALRTAIQQAEAKTDEPVAWLYIEDGEVMFGHPNGYRPPDASPLVFGDTHPAPGVPDDVVRDAISTVREQYRGTDWGKAAESICDAIDAMLAAK